MEEHRTRSARGTMRLAERFAAGLEPGAVIGLVGDLGAGKTCFVRGLARGLGVPKDVPITSPTFTVMNSYPDGRVPLYHFDLYRLCDLDELEAIGYRDFVAGDGVAVLEWADRIPDALPHDAVHIEIADGDETNHRRIRVARGSVTGAP